MKKSVAIILLSIAPSLWAETGNNAIHRAVQDTKQQLNELQLRKQQRWLQQHQYQTSDETANQRDLSRQCLPYSDIKFAGFSLINPTPFKPKTGECLNEARLNQLNKDITQAYLDQGYIHNPLQFEDDHSGLLTLRVFEGKVAKLSSDENTQSAVNLAQIFPNALDKPLRVQDLDQALDQANRITGNDLSVDVLPAKNGEIELKFSNPENAHWAGSVGLDNYASDSYNRWQGKATLSLGNPFGLSDNLYLSATHTLKSATSFNRSALLYYSVPYGYWTFNGFLSLSQFKLPIHLQTQRIEQRGRNIQGGLEANYVLHRGANHISSASLQLERINSKNRFSDVMLELQSPVINDVQIGFNHLQLFANGNLSFDLRYEQGNNARQNQPEHFYDKWNFALQFNRYQPIGEQLFRHSHQLTGQFSDHYLPAIKQDDLTGRYRVRGFNDFSLSAEKNLTLQNTLAWIKQLGEWQISPYVGFDLGIQKSSLPESHSDKALGYALGINFNHKNWFINTEWATGRLYTSDDNLLQERSIFVNFSYKF